MDSEETTDASEQWRMERYRALARRAEQSAEAVWTNARVLIPLAAALFAPLVWIECPDEYDLLVLSGPSLLLVALSTQTVVLGWPTPARAMSAPWFANTLLL